jgi:hypothetical protein
MMDGVRNLSRYAGEVEARSDEGEGAANGTVRLTPRHGTVRFAAQDGTLPLASPSPGAARHPLPRSGRG